MNDEPKAAGKPDTREEILDAGIKEFSQTVTIPRTAKKTVLDCKEFTAPFNNT